MHDIDLSNLANGWPSTYVTRNQLAKFTGGMVTPGSMAVFDSKGEGPAGRFIVNRKTAYTVKNVIEWLEARVTEVN